MCRPSSSIQSRTFSTMRPGSNWCCQRSVPQIPVTRKPNPQAWREREREELVVVKTTYYNNITWILWTRHLPLASARNNKVSIDNRMIYCACAEMRAHAVCVPSPLYCAEGKCKMRRSIFSVPTAARKSPASVPLQRAAVPTLSQRSMPAEMLEMVKSLKKKKKDILLKLSKLEEQISRLCKSWKNAGGDINSMKGSSFEIWHNHVNPWSKVIIMFNNTGTSESRSFATHFLGDLHLLL